jgi:enoyl-CoA hydratase
VARVFPADTMFAEVIKLATKIAGQSRVASLLTKKAINAAFETTLTQGVATERGLFMSLFGTPDQVEGMAAFVEKRKPAFKT